ncbi:MAG TPA: DUF2807 domain-containing protein [Bacteroidetes bacterium]|nr:DUF2807 domain-containing protein [Bacteroidota bacterium]
MKKFILPFSFLLLTLFVARISFAQVRGNGVVEEQTRLTGRFQSIVSVSSVDIVVRQGDAFTVKVVADGNLIPYIKTEVKNNTLYVSVTKNIWKAREMEVQVTLKELHKVVLSGSGDFSCERPFKTSGIEFVVSGSGDVEAALDTPAVQVKMSGSGDVELQGIRGKLVADITGSGDLEASKLQLEECTLKVTGSGDGVLKGRTAQLTVLSVGSGDVDASGLTAVVVKIKANGSGDILVHPAERLEGTLAGSGDLRYSGSPAFVKVAATGSGNVYHR